MTEEQDFPALPEPEILEWMAADIASFIRVKIDRIEASETWKVVIEHRNGDLHRIFTGDVSDARLILAKTAARYPHLKTNLPKGREARAEAEREAKAARAAAAKKARGDRPALRATPKGAARGR